MTPVAPVNIISSDEPLLLMEACDELIAQAKSAGVSEREIVEVVDKFNWNELLAERGSLSLFSDSKITDIRLAKMPNAEAQKALIELVKTADSENLLLIRFPKVEKRQKNTKWFKALTAEAKLRELWPPKAHEYVAWIQKHATQLRLNIEPQAAAKLAEQTEGNLLAAKQAIEKLLILFPEQTIDLSKMDSIALDSSRYSIFLCLDEALAGHGQRAIRMLHKFRQEAVAPIAILVNLTREIELCQKTALAGLQGQTPIQALSKSYLWESKKRLIAGAVNRLPLVIWQKLLVRCALLDRIVKGQEKGDIWQEMELCLWMLSGEKIWGRAN